MFRNILYVLPLVAFLTFGEVKSDINCDRLGVLLYDEIGCKAVKDKPEDLCPSSYDCKHLQESGQHCYFQGVKYKNKEALTDNIISDICNGGCFCDAEVGDSKFTCSGFDCAEFTGENPLKNQQCYYTYSLDSCCSRGQICPPFDDVAKCEVDGIIYKEGQRFSPKNSCQSCICQKGFSGKYEPPFCKRNNCGVEINNSGDIKNNCAPVYEDKNKLCCPNLRVCPEESDVFSPAVKGDVSAKTCKFGTKEIKSGQVLEQSVEEYGMKFDVKCDCRLPPLLTCIVVKSTPIEE